MPSRSSPTNGSSIKHDVERSNERHGERSLLLEPATERGGEVVDPIHQPDHVDEVDSLLLPVVGAVQSCDVLEVLPHRQVVVEDRLIGQVGHSRSCLDRADRMPGDLGGPFGGLEHADEHAHQRGLAAAVVADQRDPFAGADRGGRAAGAPVHRHSASPDPRSRSREVDRRAARARTAGSGSTVSAALLAPLVGWSVSRWPSRPSALRLRSVRS